jgi:hypothetical protein
MSSGHGEIERLQRLEMTPPIQSYLYVRLPEDGKYGKKVELHDSVR